jgi:hypothetical protein
MTDREREIQERARHTAWRICAGIAKACPKSATPFYVSVYEKWLMDVIGEEMAKLMEGK